MTVYDSETSFAFYEDDVAVPDRLSSLSGFIEHDFMQILCTHNHLLSVVKVEHFSDSLFPSAPTCVTSVFQITLYSIIHISVSSTALPS